METVYIYPGRFSPPTKGHFEIVKRAAKTLPKLYVINSTNPKKKDIFSTEESKELWMSYKLPSNVEIVTLSEFTSLNFDHRQLVIVRGLRDFADLADEEIVMRLNKEQYGIDKYMYFLSTCGFENISASLVREMASNMDLEMLSQYVSPRIISALLEKMFDFKNVFMVVGRPGSGKSTFLDMLSRQGDDIVHINTDKFNKELRPLLVAAFGSSDLVRVAIEREEELKAVIGKPWIELLKKSIALSRKRTNLFIEIAYGMEEDKRMYDLVGGKILYVGCENRETNLERVEKRNTKHILPFVEKIPGWEETSKIGEKNNLLVRKIDTGGDLKKLVDTARKFALSLR